MSVSSVPAHPSSPGQRAVRRLLLLLLLCTSILFFSSLNCCHQCTDTVGWASGRASGV